ncbi:nostrin isoform X2 [Bradysia coprophila]|uniref:nostrin isoform X2 n=1 Tax=Bradysia coprophila TaxID=38358 RepID=UPI00187DA29D|nr:nostrin isoform X2 [Bradysia coprophila]
MAQFKDNSWVPVSRSNSLLTRITCAPSKEGEGQNGFEELRRYLKQGGDFGKDLVAILQERVDSEQLYSKSLSKMASKLSKACREIPGSLADAWRGVATEMESRSEVHRQFSNSMVEEIVKPLKVILDNHHKTRKSIESTVDKSARILSEWRTSEAKAKKSSHAAARENEKLQDAMLDVRIQRSPSVALLHHNNHKTPEKEIKNAEKDCAKLDNKRRKAEDLVKRADVEYYTLCIRAERARVEWEMSVLRGSTILQNHENQRLTCLKNYVADYLKFSNIMNPSLNQIVDRLAPVVHACNVQKDLTVVKNIRRSSEGPSEQLLPDFYCEHTTLAMNRERRKHALVKLLQLVRTDLERERKSRNGLKELSNTMHTPENQNIADKLYHIRSMLTYLEGARFKLQSALFELDHKPRGSHPLGPHIQITRDRTGLQQSILKVPLWLKNGDEADRMSQEQFAENDLEIVDGGTEHCVDSRNETLIKHFDRNFNRSKSNVDFNNQNVVVTNNQERNGSSSPVFDRGIADGGSNQPDSDFDEFSSQDEDEELSKKQTIPRMLTTQQPAVISRCKALYNYTPKLYDELELNPGDLIDVHAKQEDGWWLGALKNKIGIFPATYVEEIA